MANYVINSPSLSTEGNDSGDYFLIQTGAFSGATVIGGAGADTIESLASAASANSVLLESKGGADSIKISGSLISGTIKAGAGGDTITLTGAAMDFNGSILGGDGSDVLDLNNTVNLTGAEVKLGAGADLVTGDSLVAASGTTFLMGAGADTIDITAAFDTGSVVGGGGADSIVIDAGGTDANDFTINGDASGVYGSDTIKFDGTAGSATILGQGGTDLIEVSGRVLNGTGTFFAGAGKDTVTFSGANVFSTAGSSVTIGGGTGDDSISLNAYTTTRSAGGALFYAQGGDGDDTINVVAGQIATAGGSMFTAGGAATVYGGDGTDSIFFSGALTSAGATTGALSAGAQGINTVLEYSDYSESNASGFDTVSFNLGDGSAGLIISVDDLDSASVGSFNNGNGTQVSNGVLVSAGSDVSSVSDRISAVDAGMTKTGAVAMITDSDGSAAYLFMQGGSTDLVVKFTNRTAALGSGSNGGVAVSAGATFGAGSSIRINFS